MSDPVLVGVLPYDYASGAKPVCDWDDRTAWERLVNDLAEGWRR